MIDFHSVSSMVSLAFRHFARNPMASYWYVGIACGLWFFVLLFSLRLIYWLRDSPAWPAVLMRLAGGLLLAGLVSLALFGGIFAAMVWGGSYQVPKQSVHLASALLSNALLVALSGAVIGCVGGFWMVFYLSRVTVPRFAACLQKSTKKAFHDELTDSRTVEELLPKPIHYDPKQYFAECERNGNVFIGLDRNRQPITIDLDLYHETHVQLVGPTGFGKGRAAQILLTQAVRRGDAVVVFDPKPGGDEWLPSVLAAECKRAGVSFRYVDLCAEVAQFNLLCDIKPVELKQLLVTGLRLSRQGVMADFYRLAERGFAKRAAQGDFGVPSSLPELATLVREAAGEEAGELRGLLDQLDELAGIAAIQTAGGLDLADVLDHGGVLYFVGSRVDEEVKLLQPMLVQRMEQLILRRDKHSGRHVVMFLDEVKYLLSTTVLDGLGAIRDRGCNLILAHQSLDELVCIDADKETTAGIVNIDCTVRLCYRQTEPRTTKWIEDQTGKIIVNAVGRNLTRNAAMSEVPDEPRHIQQVQRAAIDSNMIERLPRGCGVLIGVGEARLLFTAPIVTVPRTFQPIPAPRVVCAKVVDQLLKPGDINVQ